MLSQFKPSGRPLRPKKVSWTRTQLRMTRWWGRFIFVIPSLALLFFRQTRTNQPLERGGACVGRAVVVIIGGRGWLVSSWDVSILEWRSGLGYSLSSHSSLSTRDGHSLLVVDVVSMPILGHSRSWWLSGGGWSSPSSSSSGAVVVVLIFCLAMVGDDLPSATPQWKCRCQLTLPCRIARLQRYIFWLL